MTRHTGDGIDGRACCPICQRPLIDGPSIDRHHWVPSSHGGRDSAVLHRICHRMIHRLFSEADLAKTYSTAEAILNHPDMQRFVAWVRRQPPEYVGWPRVPRGQGRRPARRGR